MNDESHIFLVDSHSKSDGRDDDLNLILHPLLLNLLSFRVVQICMIEVTANSIVAFEHFGKLLTFFSRQAVDDATFLLETSLDQIRDVGLNVLHLLFVSNLVEQVRAVE